jgi:rhamnosyltransferase subunit B
MVLLISEESVSHAPPAKEAKTLTRKVVLATVGSLGDLHPFMALGVALRERGLNVVLACATDYQSKVVAAGIAFQPLRPAFDEIQRDLGMDRPRLTRKVIGSSIFLFRKAVLPYVRMAYEDMMDATVDADLVLTSSLAFGARLAAEKRAIPWIAVVLQPMMFLSSYDPPVIAKAEWVSALLRWLGPGATRFAMHAIKRTANLVFSPLRAVRAEIGLKPATVDPLFDGQFGAAGAIGLYSSLLGGVQADYPPATAIVGFASFDSEDGFSALLDPGLRRFLEAGPAPLVFTLGSLVINSPGKFFRKSLEVSRNVKRRAILLVGENNVAQYENLRSEDVFICAYAPHSLLFPRAAAIVHQGGIGTLAQALRSGRPQLIVPFYADQVDNAARAARLGVARVSSPRRYARGSGSRDLERLLGAAPGGRLGVSRHVTRAAQVGRLVSEEDGAVQAARIVLDRLEHLGRK